ncbi:MAG TPA: rod shape-determining protein RodA [Opitutaceae bacterium]
MKESLRPSISSLFRFTTRHRFDWLNPACMIVLTMIGIAFIYSANLATGRTQWSQQIVWIVGGAVLYVAVSMADYKIWLKLAHWVYVVCLVLLLWVLMFGSERFGAVRWIDLGPVSFQPSEVAKLSTLLICASILARHEIGSVRQSLQVLGKLALAVGIPMLLIMAQPDLGTALVIPPMVFSMLYVAKLSRRFFIGALLVFVAMVGVVAADTWGYYRFMKDNNLSFTADQGLYEPHSWIPLHDYQRNRILSMVDPEEIEPTGIGWNLRQSLISVGSGGLTGKGWTEGTQAKLGYLPRGVAHNDFIFSVLAEETGLMGGLTVLGLFGLVLVNGIRIAGIARDRFGTLLALGATVILAVHVFINIAMTIGLVPITGLPLPFISYGGSFVLGCCLLQGLVQSVYRFRRDF